MCTAPSPAHVLNEPRFLVDITGSESVNDFLRGNLRVESALTKKLVQEATCIGLSLGISSFKFAVSHLCTLSSGL